MAKRERMPQIKLSEAQRKKLGEEIKAFYLDERGEEIGMIEQIQLLDLFEQRLAPVIYNKALDDAKRWYGQMMDNLESDYYALYKNEDWTMGQWCPYILWTSKSRFQRDFRRKCITAGQEPLSPLKRREGSGDVSARFRRCMALSQRKL